MHSHDDILWLWHLIRENKIWNEFKTSLKALETKQKNRKNKRKKEGNVTPGPELVPRPNFPSLGEGPDFFTSPLFLPPGGPNGQLAQLHAHLHHLGLTCGPLLTATPFPYASSWLLAARWGQAARIVFPATIYWDRIARVRIVTNSNSAS